MILFFKKREEEKNIHTFPHSHQVFAGLLMALTYLGGDSAQITMNLPNAVTGVFQGMLLFFLLASDVLIKYHIRFLGSKRGTDPVA